MRHRRHAIQLHYRFLCEIRTISCKAVVRIPNGSYSVEIILKIPRFVSGKILVTGLSVSMFHIKPSVLSMASDPKSKLTNFGNIFDDDFNTVGEFDTNLVSRNP